MKTYVMENTLPNFSVIFTSKKWSFPKKFTDS